MEIVLTAHPTQVNRRTVQHKHNKVASLLQANDRMDMTAVERQDVQDSLMREVGVKGLLPYSWRLVLRARSLIKEQQLLVCVMIIL